jgi:putative phosphoribosyl transferase
MYLRDRHEAGRYLSGQLARYADRDDVIVLALPRGGVPVAYEIARTLHAPLDVFLVRKLGFPGNEEFAMGAIASGGVSVLNEKALREFNPGQSVIDAVAEREKSILQRRENMYRSSAPQPDLRDKTVIVVDDGLATGATMQAAIKALRKRMPRRIVVAVPVAPPSVYADLNEADEVICLMTPEPFISVGGYYQHFSQTSDQEVQQLLAEARKPGAKKPDAATG